MLFQDPVSFIRVLFSISLNFLNLLSVSILSQEDFTDEIPCFLNDPTFFVSLSANKKWINLHHEESLINYCELILLLCFNDGDRTLNIFHFIHSWVRVSLCLNVEWVLTLKEKLLMVEHDDENRLLEQRDREDGELHHWSDERMLRVFLKRLCLLKNTVVILWKFRS